MPRQPLLVVAATIAAFSSFATAQTPSWTATAAETVLSTDFVQMVSTTGVPVNVTGGVFVFDQVTIPMGCTVRGLGSRPMIWIVNTMRIDGTLSVRGGDGTRVDTLGAANFAAQGGIGGPAGGNGGAGSPGAVLQSLAGQTGFGPNNVPAAGGGGGALSWLTACQNGSGGGGGAFTTLGDPWFKTPPGTGTTFLQRSGFGGYGCTGASGGPTRVLPGGNPGGLLCFDTRTDNNFFGLGYDLAAQQFVPGELTLLTGGAGGGGGGNLSNDNTLLSPNWINDARGGGGGGGGGCLLVVAQVNIVVGPTGRIVANGGNGGGGEQAGSCNRGGGGGGGAGGMLILVAAGQIELHVKGETYANNDYDFVLSADGGVCTTGTFGQPVVTAKYPGNGQPTFAGTNYDARPLGGFGGMGTIELVARIGTNVDGTNTVFDDNIVLFSNGVPLAGAQKQRFLAWRGYRNAQGVYVDDFGAPTNIVGNEGDMRPTPALLPIF
jgi:hypothetical protein